jgi:outer membrane protein assembly factor BamB
MKTRNGFGEGSSPALVGDKLIVNWDHEGESFIVALDAATGEERWRKPREEVTSWATPLMVRHGDKPSVVVSGSKKVRAYDVASGDLLWECGGLGTNCIPMPVETEGLVFTMSGHREPGLLAIRHGDAKGDITGTGAVAWSLHDEGPPYVSSPLVYGDLLYFLQKNTGVVSCHDAKSGRLHFKERLEKITGVYASPVGAGDRIYIVGRNGVAYVLKRGPKFEVLAVNELDDSFDASPALAGGDLLLRGKKHLYCIAEQD